MLFHIKNKVQNKDNNSILLRRDRKDDLEPSFSINLRVNQLRNFPGTRLTRKLVLRHEY